MNTVVFLIYHGISHFVTTFSLAKVLAKDHTVIFAGHPFHESFVRSQGFMFYPLDSLPFGMGFEEWRNKTYKKKNVYLSTLKDRWQDRLFKERQNELSLLITNLDPAFIMIDSWLATDVVVLYPMLKGTRIRAALLHIMLPNEIVKGKPPLNSLALPEDTQGIKRAYHALIWRRRWKMFVQQLTFFGQSDHRLITRALKRSNIPAKYISKNNAVMSMPWDNIAEFTFTPREFDFPEPRLPEWRHYIGFLPDRGRMESTDKEFLKADQAVRRRVAEKNAPFVYCAFGTAGTGQINIIEKFLKNVVAACIDRGYVLMIAFPDHEKLALVAHDDVFLFKSVPQMAVLARTSVFLTHGGINSIKEAVYAGVPMLICPVNKKTDVVGNAARVGYHGLGLLGSLEEETKESIDRKLSRLLLDDQFKKNLEKLRKADEQYTASAFRELLFSLKAWE